MLSCKSYLQPQFIIKSATIIQTYVLRYIYFKWAAKTNNNVKFRNMEKFSATSLAINKAHNLYFVTGFPFSTYLWYNACMHAKSLSRVRHFVTTWTVAHQAPPSMGFSRQEYWNGLTFPSPGDLLDPGIKPRSLALQADALTSEPPKC